MADLSLPLSVDDFAAVVSAHTVSMTFSLRFRQQASGLGSGGSVVKDLGEPLWEANIDVVNLLVDDYNDLQALLEFMHGSLGTFYCYNPSRPYPKRDRSGTVLGASTVLVKDVDLSGHRFKLKGLPALYPLSRADHLSIDYGSPSARHFHRIVNSITADGSGDTDWFQVTPYIRTGAAANQAVTLKRPSALMRIVPGSVQHKIDSNLGRISLQAEQVFP